MTLALGVYDSDSARYGDYLLSAVTAFTSHYYAWARRGYQKSTDEPYEVWGPRMRKACRRAADVGMRIHLNFGQEQASAAVRVLDGEWNYRMLAERGRINMVAVKPPSYARVLDLVEPVWWAVDRVEIGDELDWNQVRWTQELDKLAGELSRRGLAWKPAGGVWQRSLANKYAGLLGLDWKGFECYCDLFAQGIYDSQKIKNDVVGGMRSWANKVPLGQGLLWVTQAYDRNGGWTNMPSLRQLNRDTWGEIWDRNNGQPRNNRTIGVNCFSYGRPGGMRDHGGLVKDWTRAAKDCGVI